MKIVFLSTPSVRRATFYGLSVEVQNDIISIHALREEGDRLSTSRPSSLTYFYPRPP